MRNKIEKKINNVKEFFNTYESFKSDEKKFCNNVFKEFSDYLIDTINDCSYFFEKWKGISKQIIENEKGLRLERITTWQELKEFSNKHKYCTREDCVVIGYGNIFYKVFKNNELIGMIGNDRSLDKKTETLFFRMYNLKNESFTIELENEIIILLGGIYPKICNIIKLTSLEEALASFQSGGVISGIETMSFRTGAVVSENFISNSVNMEDINWRWFLDLDEEEKE